MQARTANKIGSIFSLPFNIFLACLLCGCGPKIFSFDAMPRTVTNKDSVHLSWKVRGKPKIDFFQKKIANVPNDSLQLLEFMLTATKGNRQTAPRLIQVALVPLIISDRLVFAVTDRHGDTLIASGIKDILIWKGFEIVSVASVSGRAVIVRHQGAQAALTDSGAAVQAFRGLGYDGSWEMRTLITPIEKSNNALIPDRLQLIAIIQPKKH